jgi:CheY-like chemotaxis protein
MQPACASLPGVVVNETAILLVEDNPDHAELTRRALEDRKLANSVVWVRDGQEALDYLFQRGSYAGASHPGLILLDIRLPKLSGIEVLKAIKEHEHLRVIPVIMLTTSDRDEEALRCYSYGANSFITKPVQFDEFFEKVTSLKFYWLLTNRPPRAE